MNPGLMDTRLSLWRKGSGRGEDGALIDEWSPVGDGMWARRLKPKGGAAAMGDEPRDREKRLVSFRVRNLPFLREYRNGDEFRETRANNLPAARWRILNWSEATESARGDYIDVACESVVD